MNIVRLLFIFVTLLLSESFLMNFARAEGGNSSGGGGFNVRDTNRPQIGVGNFGHIFRVPESDEQKKIEDLVRDKKATASTCPGTNRLVAQLPKFFKNAFVLKTEDGKSLSADALCANEGILQSYTSFALALIQLDNREKGDGVGKELIEQIGLKGKPIPITIHRERPSHVAVGGSIEESTWFDKKDGIHWASKEICQGGIDCHMAVRTEGSLLVHELILFQLHRQMGNKYPESQAWHDVRFVKKSTSGMGADYDNLAKKLYLSKTSEAAAFVEGLANAFEVRHFLEESPFLERDTSLSRVNPNNCYYSLNKIALSSRFSNASFSAPAASEVYVGSAVSQLFNAFRPSKEALDGDPEAGIKGYLIKSVNTDRMIHLFKAINAHKPTNVEELAQALDKEEGGDNGRRWLREFFFYDYVSKEKIGQNFKTKKIGDRSFDTCSPDPSFYAKSFSFVRAQEEVQTLALAKALHAKNTSPTDLVKAIQKTQAHSKKLRAAALKKISVDQFEVTCEKLVEKGICERSNDEKSFSNFLDNIFDVLRKADRSVADGDLEGIFRRVCGSPNTEDIKRFDLGTLVARLDDAEKKAEALKKQQTTVDTPDHLTRIQAWFEAKAEMEEAAKRLDELVAVYSAALRMPGRK